MSFHLYYSNHLDTLQYITGYITKIDPQKSPFDKEYFLVQNFGMARWMQIKLAKQLGILTQSEFLLPAKMLMNLLEMIFSEEEREKKPIERLSKDELFWPLVKIIDDARHQEDASSSDELFTPIQNYLTQYDKDTTSKQDNSPLLGVLHLAQELAAIFDKYIVYRSQWINAWTKGELAPAYFDQKLPVELEAWQAALFKKLYENLGSPLHFGLLHPLIEQKLQDPKVISKLPKRLFIIGLNSLPPLFLDLIAQFSKVMDIHLFFNNPSQYYWGDLTKNSELPNFNLINFFEQAKSQIDPISPHIPKSVLNTLNEHWQNSYGNPLLASLGKVGRDHLHLLQKYDGDLDLQITEAFSEPEIHSLLQHLQAEIYHLRPARESTPFIVTPNDRSIQLHCTYSPMREVEALYDQILHQLEHNPDLAPEDIVVMTPDIESYAPFINAIFGSAPKERYLPYSISDISLKESETIFTTLLQILSLPESAFKASDLLLLLQMPEIMAQFHFEENDLSLIHFWIHDANIKQAIDGEHLTEELKIPYQDQFDWDINSWRWGLQRMLLGYGTESSPLDLYHPQRENEHPSPHTIMPYPHIEGKNAEILGNLCHFLDLLISTKDLLSGEKTIAQWRLILPKVWQDFFPQTPENSDKLHYTQKLWQNILEGADKIGFTKELPLKALTPLLENKLLEEKPEQNFIQGKITFCSFIPMRTIPFKMIAMIGMNQADFPKSTVHHSFDLIQYQPMRGDRSRNTDDRYLFLEALLSAKETLYLSYIGRSIRDNSTLYPSLLIDELLRYIDQVSTTSKGIETSAKITSLHPMASYNPALFKEKSMIQSFQNEWILMHENIEDYHAPYNYLDLICNYEAQDRITPLTDLSLEALIRFYQDPCQYFAEQRLNLSPFRDQTTSIEDDEPFTIHKGLDEYQFYQALTHNIMQSGLALQNSNQEIISESTIDEITQSLYQNYRLQGMLPKFAYGEISWLDKSLFPKELAKNLFESHYPYGQFNLLSFKSGITLHGKIPKASIEGNIILFEVGLLKHDRIMKGAITNLFYHATKTTENIAETLLLIGRGKEGIQKITYPYYQQSEAATLLTHLIKGYLTGIKGPIPYLYKRQSQEEIFQDSDFKEALMTLRSELPQYFKCSYQTFDPEIFYTLLKDEDLINSLVPTIRKQLNKVKSLVSGNNSFNRLFPQYGDKEIFGFILFYHHYLDELMPHEQ